MKVTSRVEADSITKKACEAFDFQFEGEVCVELPDIPKLPGAWSVGVIVGPSGSGKSKLLEQMDTLGEGAIPAELEWDPRKSIVAHFESADDAIERLGAVGLNSIPSWAKPYQVLSNGERHRADIARALRSGVMLDEFTSVVDRSVAKSLSVALRRYVDGKGLQGLVLATCHYDVIPWLDPDWVFDTATRKLTVGRSLRRPVVELELLPCTAEAWSVFRQHHYLDGNINRSARCWVAVWDGVLVGFASALAFPNANFKNAWREHRTVVLPDFQGMGLGVRISDAVAKGVVEMGGRYFSKTAHPRMGAYREASPAWRATSKNGKARPDYGTTKTATKEDGHKLRHTERVCYSHEYVVTS